MTSVYQQILGQQFDLLDSAVRRFHRLQGNHRLDGHCSIRGAESLTAKIIGSLLRLPASAARVELEFHLKADEREETWIRYFPRRTMRSRLRPAAGGLLGERIGPARFLFSLTADQGALRMHLQAIRILGIPWPKRWFPEVWAVERGDQGRFHFDVGARFRRAGMLVAYSGHLDLPTTTTP